MTQKRMSENFDITVAIILHGDPPQIRRVVESVRAQQYSYGNITIICLDDGTSPHARQAIDDLKIITIDLPQDSSISVAKNAALRLADSEFVFLLDDHIYLEPGGISAAMEAFRTNPRLAGVCGFYRSVNDSDWNLLRDIKRHTIYGKADNPRLITLDQFTTFSTGIGIVRRSVFGKLNFPEDVFSPDFGGEDIPALIIALNQGYEFAYVPALRGIHEHNLTFSQFLKKFKIEVRGRYSVFYWATNHKQMVIPYLHGFLNFPVLFYLSVPLAFALGLMWGLWVALIPVSLLLFECALSLRCMFTTIPYRWSKRLLATLYVLISDLLAPLWGLHYLLSKHKRPYSRLDVSQFLTMIRVFLKWEMIKYGIYKLPAKSNTATAVTSMSKRFDVPSTANKPFFPQQKQIPARLKISLLSNGVQFPLDAFAMITRDFYPNQFVYGRTSKCSLRSHRIPQAFKLDDGVISAVLRREDSPWKIKVDQDRVFLHDGTRGKIEIELPERPAYFGKTLSNGQRSEDFIAVAGEVVPGFFLYPDCHYFDAGAPCAFCSLRHTRKTAGKEMARDFPVDIVAEATRLFQQTPWKDIPIISISTGTFPDNDEGARYTSSIVKAIYDELQPKLPIHVLTMPPDSLDLIELYREAGATSIAFNIEVFDCAIFKDICPGKHRYYGYDKLLSALMRAAKIFGPYNSFCGFVWGLESEDSLLEGYRWCLNQGISLSSNVFHSDQGSVFADRQHPSEEFILSLCENQSSLYDQYPQARTIFPVSMRSTLDWEIYRGDFR